MCHPQDRIPSRNLELKNENVENARPAMIWAALPLLRTTFLSFAAKRNRTKKPEYQRGSAAKLKRSGLISFAYPEEAL
jgi:hypothetical protein